MLPLESQWPWRWMFFLNMKCRQIANYLKTLKSNSNYTFNLVDFGTPAYDETVRLRRDILRIPLDLEFYPEDLALEYDQYHLAGYDRAGNLVACLVLKALPNLELKMRQVAVQENLQKRGIGQLMVAASEEIGRDFGFKKMVLHARKTAVPFYKKLSYKTSGKEFLEVEIPHYKMVKNL